MTTLVYMDYSKNGFFILVNPFGQCRANLNKKIGLVLKSVSYDVSDMHVFPNFKVVNFPI